MLVVNDVNLSKNIVNTNELVIITVSVEEILAIWQYLLDKCTWENIDSKKTWEDIELFIF